MRLDGTPSQDEQIDTVRPPVVMVRSEKSPSKFSSWAFAEICDRNRTSSATSRNTWKQREERATNASPERPQR